MKNNKKKLIKDFLNYLINELETYNIDTLLLEKDDIEYKKIKHKYKNILEDLEKISDTYGLEIDVFDAADDFVLCFYRHSMNKINELGDEIYKIIK